MTEREALRLALEALEEISHVNTYQNEDDEVGMKLCCDQVSYQPHSTDCQTMKAITAIKQALEQPEPDSVPNYCPECLTYNGHQEGCSHHTSPPKRESEPKPVAWMMVNPTHLPNSKSLHWEPQQWHISWEAVPLYTTPPKREPEPEPVGYLYVTDPWGAPEYHFSVEKKEGYFNEPVYKHPPKRELLTDEQEIQLIAELAMVEASGSTDGVARLGLAGAEEVLEIFKAAHGIKGEA